MLSTIYSFHGSLYSFPIRTLLSNCGHILHINSLRDFGLYFLHIDILGHTYNQESFYYKNGYSSQGETLVLLHCQCTLRFGRVYPYIFIKIDIIPNTSRNHSVLAFHIQTVTELCLTWISKQKGNPSSF